MKTTRITILCLLFALPLALRGQANLPKHQSTDWVTLVNEGGIRRSDNMFVRVNDGISSLVMMDYVNGFSLGPKLTLGKVLPDLSRIEVESDVKWAFSRNRLMAKGALRYVFAPQYNGFIEAFAGQFTNDYDRYPLMDDAFRSLAVSLFGWDHNKLYEQTTAGARLYGALGPYWQLTALVAWEKRRQLDNYRQTNVFGKPHNGNVPVVHGQEMEAMKTNSIARLDMQIDFQPGRRIVVADDMNSYSVTERPVFSLRETSGFNRGLQFLSLDFSMYGRQQAWRRYQQFMYFVSAGFFPVRKQVMLMDMRHMDAQDFALHRGFLFTRFSLLDNYELSTSKNWIECHAELNNGLLYGQIHGVKIAEMPAHEELSVGISLVNVWRIGCSVGFNEAKYDGVALNIGLKI